MKLSKWAKEQGVSYRTALNWFHAGKLPVRAEQMPSGTIIVYEDELSKTDSSPSSAMLLMSHSVKPQGLVASSFRGGPTHSSSYKDTGIAAKLSNKYGFSNEESEEIVDFFMNEIVSEYASRRNIPTLHGDKLKKLRGNKGENK